MLLNCEQTWRSEKSSYASTAYFSKLGVHLDWLYICIYYIAYIYYGSWIESITTRFCSTNVFSPLYYRFGIRNYVGRTEVTLGWKCLSKTSCGFEKLESTDGVTNAISSCRSIKCSHYLVGPSVLKCIYIHMFWNAV